jgi:hypothetical protein
VSTVKPETDSCHHPGRQANVISLYKNKYMNSVLTPEIKDVMHAVHYRPAVSIILPFEPKMGLRTEISHSLKLAADKVEKELAQSYTQEIKSLMMDRIRDIIHHLDFNTYKKSIAIYVSPVFQKVLYLDMPVEEKIIIDESFEIRDLVYSKKELHKYLVLLLSGKESKMYLGNHESFVRISSNKPESVYAYVNEAPEKVSNYSDHSERKEVIMDKFLHHIDNGLGIILHSYQLPVFVIGTERIMGHFKKISRHSRSVMAYIHGNHEDAGMEELKKIISPHVADWKKLKEKELLGVLEEAAGQKKLVTGMKEVWKEAMHRNGRLLIVEKDFMYAADHGAKEDQIEAVTDSRDQHSYIKDAVDDVIEKVLDNGGDVEFVDPPLLDFYQHIVLVKFY